MWNRLRAVQEFFSRFEKAIQTPNRNSGMDITEAELAVLNNAVAGKGKLIFVMVCGSAAFNLNLPSSDRDLFGVYVADEKGPYTKPSPSMNSNDPDYCIYGTLAVTLNLH